jgi:ATP-dependent Clp protease protease subunit
MNYGYFGSNYVFEPGIHGDNAYSLPSWLQKNKKLCLFSAIDEDTTNNLVAQLLYANTVGWDEVDLYINSPGGLVTGLFSILDTMEMISTKVNTICVGEACSAAAVLLACGHKRSATKRSRVMFHDLSYGTRGTFQDVEIVHQETIKMRNQIAEILTQYTALSSTQVEQQLMCRNKWFSPEEAIEIGALDSIHTK